MTRDAKSMAELEISAMFGPSVVFLPPNPRVDCILTLANGAEVEVRLTAREVMAIALAARGE